jgi:TRAP-type mannitol/chloroaromatic compound transport system permease small subunit
MESAGHGAPQKPEIKLDLEKVDEKSSRGHGLDFPRTSVSDALEAVVEFVGRTINWIWIVLVLVIVGNVVGRYVFSVNYIWVEEMQWHMYAVGFMLGIGYAVKHDAHVRVDVLAMTIAPADARLDRARRHSRAARAPVIYVILASAIPFVEASWSRGERSSAPGGLANRWAIKGVIIVAFVYLGLATLARFLRICALLFGFPKPRAAA